MEKNSPAPQFPPRASLPVVLDSSKSLGNEAATPAALEKLVFSPAATLGAVASSSLASVDLQKVLENAKLSGPALLCNDEGELLQIL